MKQAAQSDSIQFGHYLVAFIDILGQRSKLRSLTDLPKNDAEKEQFIQKIKATFGAVDGVRKWLTEFYTAFETRPSRLNDLPQDQRELYARLKSSDLKFQQFGDTMLMYVSLAGEHECKGINGVYASFVAAGITMLCSLAAGNPVRGAIDVGIGGEMYEGEIYGQCLNNANFLESKIAGYPRIVVGKQAVNYLLDLQRDKSPDIVSQFKKKLAGSCLSLLAKDTDGHLMIDYLGKGFTEVTRNANLDPALIQNAGAFVERQCSKWQKENNDKLAHRYGLLRQYFRARKLA